MKKLTIILSLIGLLLFVVPAAYASDGVWDKIIMGEDFTLKAGETVSGDLVVMGGNVVIEAGAQVTGNVVVFGGNVEISGAVGRDMVIFGGNAKLNSTAVIERELVTFGGAITRQEGAQIKGGESQGVTIDSDRRWNWNTPRMTYSPWEPVMWFVHTLFQAIGVTLGLSLLALVIAVLLPEHTARVSAAITTAPLPATFMGLLTLIAVPVLIFATAITICLSPFSAIGALLYGAAFIFGWVALGALLGARLTAALKWQNLSPALSTTIGTFVLTVLSYFFTFILPCVGWVIPTLLACAGLGAVTLTRFGTRPYLTSAPVSPAPPEPPVAPADTTVVN